MRKLEDFTELINHCPKFSERDIYAKPYDRKVCHEESNLAKLHEHLPFSNTSIHYTACKERQEGVLTEQQRSQTCQDWEQLVYGSQLEMQKFEFKDGLIKDAGYQMLHKYHAADTKPLTTPQREKESESRFQTLEEAFDADVEALTETPVNGMRRLVNNLRHPGLRKLLPTFGPELEPGERLLSTETHPTETHYPAYKLAHEKSAIPLRKEIHNLSIVRE